MVAESKAPYGKKQWKRKAAMENSAAAFLYGENWNMTAKSDGIL